MNFEPILLNFLRESGKCCGQLRIHETFCLSCAIGSLPVLSIFLRENGKYCGQPRIRETFCLSCAIGPSRLPVPSPKAPSSEPQIVQPRGPERKNAEGRQATFAIHSSKIDPIGAPKAPPKDPEKGKVEVGFGILPHPQSSALGRSHGQS